MRKILVRPGSLLIAEEATSFVMKTEPEQLNNLQGCIGERKTFILRAKLIHSISPFQMLRLDSADEVNVFYFVVSDNMKCLTLYFVG